MPRGLSLCTFVTSQRNLGGHVTPPHSCAIQAFTPVAWQREHVSKLQFLHGVNTPHCSLLKAVEQPNSVSRFLFFRGLCLRCLCSVSSCGDHSPTATTAPSLGPLVPNSSLIRCEPVQVFYHHPRPRVPLDPVYYII
jgi:hypothetical protein